MNCTKGIRGFFFIIFFLMSWQNKENKTGIFFSFGEIQSLQMTPLRLSMTVCMDSDLKKITQLGGPCVCIIMQLVYY